MSHKKGNAFLPLVFSGLLIFSACKETGTEEEKTFTVTWKNHDGTVLEVDENVLKGATPTFDGTTPTKAGTDELSYTFTGWSPEVGAVEADTVYTAQFTSSTNTYTITWKNGDTVLKTDTVNYGATPAYEGAAPTKTADAQYTYTFDGWEPAIGPVTKNETYSAKFARTVNKYTVTWKNGDTVLETDSNVEYGTTPTFDGTAPSKAADAQYTYEFDGWDKEVAAVTGDVTYSAKFKGTVNKYTVTWKNANGLTLEVDNDVAYGIIPTYDGSTPVKDADVNSPKYRFVGWDKEVVAVTGDVTYEAKFAAYADLAMIDDFESYKDTVDLLGGGWDQMIYNSTTNTWSNSGTGAVVSYGTRSEDGEGALRFDSYANNVTYGFGKDIDASLLNGKSANALMFKMMMPSITEVKVKLILEEMDLPNATGGTQRVAPYFTKTLPALVSGEYVNYIIPMDDAGWYAWSDSTKGSLAELVQGLNIDVDDVAKLVRRIEFYTKADDGNSWPFVGFLDHVCFVTSNVTSFTATPTLYLSKVYTGKTVENTTIKFTLGADSTAAVTIIDSENPSATFNGNVTLNGLDFEFRLPENGELLKYQGRLINGGKSIKCTGIEGYLAASVGEADLYGVQVVDNFESYSEDGVAYYKDHAAENRSGCRGTYYSEYYAGSGSSPWGASGWSLLGGSGDQLKMKSDGGGHNGSNKYLCMKNSKDNAMRYMTYGLYDGTAEQNAFRGSKFSFWVRTYERVPEFTVRAYSTSKPTPSSIDERVKKAVLVEDSAVGSWKHYEIDLNPNLIYYGFMIFMEKNLVKESFLYIDDVEVYTASPYSKYEAPQTLSLKSGATYSGKMGGLVNAMLDITSSSTANLLIPSKREMSSGTYSIVNDEVTFSFIGGAVEYKAKISKDLNKLSFISSNTDNAIGAALQNCNFDRMDIVEDSDYESAGKMFYQNSDAASRSGARGAYYCDYYNNNENNSSPVGGKKWILMGGGGDQLDLDESDSFVGTKSLKMKSSTAGAMRYLQWGLYDGTSVAHRGYNSFSVFMKNPNNFDVKVKIVVYKIYKVAPSTQDYKVTKEVTVPANSDWTQYTAPLDANTSYYGYGIICVQNSSTGYINVDCAYFHNDYDDPLLTYFAKQDLTLTGAVNSGNATIKFGAKTQVYLTCAAANFTNKACTYSWKINDLGDQILTIKINDSTFIQGKYTVDDTGKAKFEVTSAVSADGSLGQLISNGATFVS